MECQKKKVSIHLTDLCNNRCLFCVVDSPGQKVDQVSRERIDEFLQKNKDLGYSAVNLHGGEPTIREDFIDILDVIKKNGYPSVILQTNGRKFVDRNFAAQVHFMGVKLFVVSLHGASAATHNSITRVPGSFEETIQGIRNIHVVGGQIRSNTVVSKINYKELPEIVDLLLSLRVNHINISALHTAGAAFKKFHQVTPSYREIEPVVRKSVEKAVTVGTKVTLEGFPYCSIRGLEHYVIDWNVEKFKMLFRNYILEDYEEYMDRNMRVHGKPCIDCIRNTECGGVYKEYIAMKGWNEFGYDVVQ